MSDRRKSVSWAYFTATASILLVSLLAMGLLQMALSINYFSDMRRSALTSVVDITEAQLMAFSDGTSLFQGDTDSSKRLDLINSTTEAVLAIADTDGNLMRMVGGDDLMGGATVPQKLRERMDDGEDVFVVGKLGGAFAQRCYTVGRAVTLFGCRYYLFAASPSTEMNEYVGNMFSSFILSAGLMLLLSSVLSIVFGGRITLPLRRISEAAAKFGGGDLSVRVPVEGDNEIAQLAVTFNTMAANLQTIDNSRGEFMGNIAHELRTPMTTIKGFIDGMLDGTIPPEMHEQYLQLVSMEVGRLSRLVQNMLDITKLEAGEYKVHARDYDVWETITGVVLGDEQRIRIGRIEIMGLTPVRTGVHADPDLVHQVVFNLMDNAIKFTPEGGVISLNVAKKGHLVEVSIQNTGEGISPEALPFVFERFYKEDKSRGLNVSGSGLGLHICKVLINLQGGSIKVESEPGAWCRFSFTLPAAALDEDPRARRSKDLPVVAEP